MMESDPSFALPSSTHCYVSYELPSSSKGTDAALRYLAQPAVIINWDLEGDHVDWFSSCQWEHLAGKILYSAAI